MNNHTQVECTMNPLRSCLVSVLTLAALGCHGDAVTNPPAIHKAGIHYVNAVPDTMQQDVRIMDIVSNSGLFDANFRTYDMFYKDIEAGTRHVRIFLSSTDPAVTSIVLFDTSYNFTEGQDYTFIHAGFSRSGQTPRRAVWILQDNTPAPGAGQVGFRFIQGGAGSRRREPDSSWVGYPAGRTPHRERRLRHGRHLPNDEGGLVPSSAERQRRLLRHAPRRRYGGGDQDAGTFHCDGTARRSGHSAGESDWRGRDSRKRSDGLDGAAISGRQPGAAHIHDADGSVFGRPSSARHNALSGVGCGARRPHGVQGRQRGMKSSVNWELVTRVRPEPSACITHRSPSLSNASRFLSGDQAGSSSGTLGSVSCRTPLPSAFITKMAKSPARSEWNAIFVPSGDHAGPTSVAALFVTFAGLVPSAFMTKISALPVRSDTNAILVPSGDQAGCSSAVRFVVSRVTPVPSAFIR